MHPTGRRKLGRSGFTLIEGMVACTLLSLVIIGTIILFTSTCRLWRVGTSGTDANSYGSLAMRRVITEVQEGQSASIEGSRLVVVFPYYDSASGSYQKTAVGDTIEYYLSGDSGTESPVVNGDNCLWKEVNGSRSRVARRIKSFQPSVPSDEIVSVLIKGADTENALTDPDLIRQSVRLRNY
jgi:hypothetical protein